MSTSSVCRALKGARRWIRAWSSWSECSATHNDLVERTGGVCATFRTPLRFVCALVGCRGDAVGRAGPDNLRDGCGGCDPAGGGAFVKLHVGPDDRRAVEDFQDRKSTRLNSSHV